MDLYDLLEDYFVDSEDAVRTLITWFLKQVWNLRPYSSMVQKNMNGMIAGKLKETAIENDH